MPLPSVTKLDTLGVNISNLYVYKDRIDIYTIDGYIIDIYRIDVYIIDT